MSMATAVAESIITSLVDVPLDVSVIYAYAPDEHKIYVPVYLREETPFAPPFLIPKGNWTVVYEVKTPGWVFESVTYHPYPPSTSLPPGVRLSDDLNATGQTTWTTPFDNRVTDVNMLGCTIVLQSGSDSFDSDSFRKSKPGDPTIAVVKEPMDG